MEPGRDNPINNETASGCIADDLQARLPYCTLPTKDGSWLFAGQAPRGGVEPPTNRLTAGCSTIELPRIDAAKCYYKSNILLIRHLFSLIFFTLLVRDLTLEESTL